MQKFLYYKHTGPGRDFVVTIPRGEKNKGPLALANPEVKYGFAGYFSGKGTSFATLTRDLSGLEAGGTILGNFVKDGVEVYWWPTTC